MAKSKNLGWAWKGSNAPYVTATKRIKQKRKRKGGKHGWLLSAPGEVFYDSKPWKKLRAKVFATYGRKCMRCDVVHAELQVDHIKPRSKFPKLALSFHNLQVLCRACNMKKWNYHSTDYREASAARDLDLQTVREARERI